MHATVAGTKGAFATMAAEGTISTSNNVTTLTQPQSTESPIAPRACSSLFVREISELPPEQIMYTSGPYQVIAAFQSQAPRVVEEIGRLREVNFRAVGEGTGLAIDL